MALCVAPCVASQLDAQQRIADALAMADYASGVLSSYAACAEGLTAGQPPAPVLPGLPALPGSEAPPPRRWTFAASGGAFVVSPDGRESHRWIGGAALRTHFVPAWSCRFDFFLTASGVTSGAGAATVDARWFLAPRSSIAPALELSATGRTLGRRKHDAEARPNATLRLSGTTPNLYALTLGRLVDAVVGAKSPKLDIRARLFGGAAMPVQGKGAMRRTFAQAGGLGGISVLHFPVALLVSSEHGLGGGLPRDQFRSRTTVGGAFRLPCCGRDAWLVARAGNDRGSRGGWPFMALELTNLSFGR